MTYGLAASGMAPDQLIGFFQRLSPGLPPEAWWLIALSLLVLGIAAGIDAFTGMVPDALIFPALIALLAGLAIYIDWPEVARHLLHGLAAAFILWAVNEIWYRLFRHDAFGMGDVKWSVLAAASLGPLPVLAGWGAGACIAVLWLGALQAARRPARHVHFAPFLFAGLMAAAVWISGR